MKSRLILLPIGVAMMLMLEQGIEGALMFCVIFALGELVHYLFRMIFGPVGPTDRQ